MQNVEVALQVLLEPGDGHAIDAASALVLLHALPRSPQIPPVIDLADQRVRLLRLAWFASLPGSPPPISRVSSRTPPRSLPQQPSVRRSPTHPTPRPVRPLQRDPFPLDDAFWVAVPPPHTGTIPGLLLFPGS